MQTSEYHGQQSDPVRTSVHEDDAVSFENFMQAAKAVQVFLDMRGYANGETHWEIYNSLGYWIARRVEVVATSHGLRTQYFYIAA